MEDVDYFRNHVEWGEAGKVNARDVCSRLVLRVFSSRAFARETLKLRAHRSDGGVHRSPVADRR